MIRPRLWSLVLAATAVFVLAGCAVGPTPYAPMGPDGDTGYSDTQLTATRYRVGFSGNSLTDRETVENYLLYRAAEVTRKAGYHWFVFDTRNTQAKTTYMTEFAGWPGWGGYGWYWHSWAFEPPFPRDMQSRPVTRYRAYAEIVLLTPDQAKREPKAIDADELIAHLQARIERPRPASPDRP